MAGSAVAIRIARGRSRHCRESSKGFRRTATRWSRFRKRPAYNSRSRRRRKTDYGALRTDAPADVRVVDAAAAALARCRTVVRRAWDAGWGRVPVRDDAVEAGVSWLG